MFKRCNPIIALAGALLFCPAVIHAADRPWRLDDALGLPPFLSLSGEHRIRYENLDNQFRADRDGGDQALLLRTLLAAELDFGRFRVGAELQDSRAQLADTGTPLTTSVVNPLTLLQAYLDVDLNDALAPGAGTLRAGRITMDAGSRRLIARNRYRNTINAFTGVDWRRTGADNSELRGFFTLPVQRRVAGNILDNKPEFDKESGRVRFWGIYYAPGELPWGDKGELYYLGLDEDDSPGRATANRDIHTLGLRLYRPASRAGPDYQVETVWQFGTSRASKSASTDLDHFAHFQHLELGYSFAAPGAPRVQLLYDYASGDDGANGDNHRFTTLYGSRRSDFGPTSLYGPFARANLSAPGVRLTLRPDEATELIGAARGYWLASGKDTWTTANVSATDKSGRYIGIQAEVRVRWELPKQNTRLEAGAARLWAGDLMRAAGKANATCVYTQVTFRF